MTSSAARVIVAGSINMDTRLELAERYGIGRTSVAKLLREWREKS